MRRGAARAAMMLVAAFLAAPSPALADGDPASDVLLGQNVFLPYSPISQSTERRLYAVCDAAHQAGYPLRVALIASRSDLGVVPSLFGKPQSYARFLSAELAGVVNGPVLVVMRAGFGLAQQGRSLPATALGAIKPRSASADGLGAAAILAARRLAAAAGHPLPVSLTGFSPTAGASPATVRHALVAIAVLLALSALGIAFALRARSRLRA